VARTAHLLLRLLLLLLALGCLLAATSDILQLVDAATAAACCCWCWCCCCGMSEGQHIRWDQTLHHTFRHWDWCCLLQLLLQLLSF
jgi:hypothetical protein